MSLDYQAPKPIITYTLIVLCVLFFIPVATETMPVSNPFALYFPENPQFHLWQYVSSMFMHGGPFHLLLNMFALWMFGSVLERLWGGSRFLVFYMLCGVGSGLIYNWINLYQFNGVGNQLMAAGLTVGDLQRLLSAGVYPNIQGIVESQVSSYYQLYHVPTVGASGAIYGILVAYAVCFPNNKLMLIFVPYPVPAKYFVPVLIFIDLLSGVTGFSIFGGGIAHFAHVSGALVGFLLVLVFGRPKNSPFTKT